MGNKQSNVETKSNRPFDGLQSQISIQSSNSSVASGGGGGGKRLKLFKSSKKHRANSPKAGGSGGDGMRSPQSRVGNLSKQRASINRIAGNGEPVDCDTISAATTYHDVYSHLNSPDLQSLNDSISIATPGHHHHHHHHGEDLLQEIQLAMIQKSPNNNLTVLPFDAQVRSCIV